MTRPAGHPAADSSLAVQPRSGRIRDRRIERLAAAEPLVVAILAPALLLPGRWTVLAFALLPLLWLIRWRSRGFVSVRTAADAPIAGILAMTVVSLFASFDLTYSLPKAAGIVLGVATYYAIVNAAPTGRLVPGLALGLVAIGVGTAVVGLLGTSWFASKVFGATGLIAGLPSIAGWLPRSALPSQQVGVHPNELGGALALLIPVPAALVFAGGARWRRLALIVIAATLVVVLVLTQSRSAWIGTLVAGGWLAFVASGRRVRVVLGLALGCGLIGAVAVGPERMLHLLDSSAGSTGSDVSRLELWGRVWSMIQDFPFTGVGLNTFPFVLTAFYPTLASGSDQLIPHAHNIYLQAAVDLGGPGFVAFLALLAAAARMARSASRAAADWKPLARGCTAGLLAFCVYGLTDAITLGAKPGFIFWMMIGTLGLLARRSSGALPGTVGDAAAGVR